MSDAIKHECGIVLIRLLKPLQYFQDKYGSSLYGLNKLYLLMEKQHNRGQDGAGIGTIKFDLEAGRNYINRYRANDSQPIKTIFNKVYSKIEQAHKSSPEDYKNPEWLKRNAPFIGELYLGHLRYGTYGKNDIRSCHPFIRKSNWKTRNFMLAGNFNLTNVDELFNQLVEIGQYPKERKDTVTALEKIGHFIDMENNSLHHKYNKDGIHNKDITALISQNMDLPRILSEATKKWDGGYAICGMLGHGDAFVMRDPAGIRPAFYYHDDEIAIVTSERPAIQTALNIQTEQIKEIKPGHALIIKRNGEISENKIKEPLPPAPCSFERIYFSRGSDRDIYQERKMLGKLLAPSILKSVNYDIANTVFSFIPNTAETSFYGVIEGVNDYIKGLKKEKLKAIEGTPTDEQIEEILSLECRVEKVAIKDAKLRTFITQDNQRDDLVEHVYDITYGSVRPNDNLVLIDDSIVRGTTLKQSILRITDRLQPKKIVIASSAPQIRYPDCYGIDMARLGDFAAFKAMIALNKENGKDVLIQEVYKKCKAQLALPKEEIQNFVKDLYKDFTAEQISAKIAEQVRPYDINAEVEIVYQSIENLHESCPNNKGDWYFTGNYPTPGGNKVVNQSYVNFIEGRTIRAY
ncbi:MAG: hypothetical protein OCD01_18065 [Fibrobacterales bacterium]